MRVLVTGAGGFIAGNIIEKLSGKHKITGVYRKSVNFSSVDQNKRLDFNPIVIDLSQEFDIEGEFDVIIHTASKNPGTEINFDDFFRDNIKSTENILKFANKKHINKIIYLGAVSSYGRVDGGILKEDTPHNDTTYYGLTKYVAEELILNSKIDARVLILPGVVGKGCRENFLTNTVCKFIKGEEVTYFNPNGYFNNVVLVDDVSDFIDKLLDSDFKGNKRLILGSNDSKKMKEIINYLKNRYNKSGVEEIEGDVNPFILDISQAIDEGYTPHSLDFILDNVCIEMEKRLSM